MYFVNSFIDVIQLVTSELKGLDRQPTLFMRVMEKSLIFLKYENHFTFKSYR